MSNTRSNKSTRRVSEYEIKNLKSDKELRAAAKKKRGRAKSKGISWRELTGLADGNESFNIHSLESRTKKTKTPQTESALIPAVTAEPVSANISADDDIYSKLEDLEAPLQVESESFEPLFAAQLNESGDRDEFATATHIALDQHEVIQTDINSITTVNETEDQSPVSQANVEADLNSVCGKIFTLFQSKPITKAPEALEQPSLAK